MHQLPAQAARASLADELEAVLHRHVLGAWFPACIDAEAGGFLCDFDRRWRPSGPQHRMLEFQARQTRLAARAAIAYPREPRFREATLHGFRYLRDVMWDRVHGGWFWMLDRRGQPLEAETKHAHGSTYAIGACALVFAATGDPDALALAQDGFAWLDRFARDPLHGGYHNWLRRAGTVIADGADSPRGRGAPEPLGHAIGLKDINVHGDALEAFMDLLEVAPLEVVRQRVAELFDLITGRLITGGGAVHFLAEPDWTPIPTLERYGNTIQTVHRMVRARRRLEGISEHASTPHRVMRHVLEAAWAGPTGGLWDAGPGATPDSIGAAPALLRRRSWWVQYEGLRALLLLGADETSPEAPYFRHFCQLWAFIRRSMLDARYGGVYHRCPADLPRWQRLVSPARAAEACRKGDVWKDGSHEGEALIACIRLLRSRPGGPL